MPLFTYECEDCESSFEVLVSFSQSKDLIPCPECRGQKTHKKLSLVARMAGSSSSDFSFSPPAASCAPGGT